MGGRSLWLSPNRIYNPQLGRFISPDPIGEQGGINLYKYCFNDPLNKIDPLGLDVIMLVDSNAVPLNDWILHRPAAGHSATLIGSNATGWIYFSKDGYFRGNSVASFDSFSSFYNNIISQRYDKGNYINTSPEQDFFMLMAGLADGDNYSFKGHNCADLTDKILKSGGISISNSAFHGFTIPILQYEQAINQGIAMPFDMHPKFRITN